MSTSGVGGGADGRANMCLVTKHVADGGMAVFPNEVVARHWQRALLRESMEATMWTDNIVAWDRFIRDGAVYGLPMEVDEITRTLFAYDTLRENKRRGATTRLVPAHIPHGAPIGIERITALLPHLSRLIESPDIRDRQIYGELHALYERYQDFLMRHGMRERGAPEISSQRRILLYYPQLIADYERYSEAIASMDNVDVIDAPQSMGAMECRIFPTVEEELEAAAHRIGGLLRDGCAMDEILVCAAGLAEIAPVARSIFTRYAIPHTIHTAIPLSHTVYGRLLTSFQRAIVYQQPYSLCYELFEDTSIPWSRWVKERDIAARARRRNKMYRTFGKEVSALLNELGSADSFSALHASAHKALHTLIDADGWSAEHLMELQYATRVLRQLMAAQQRYGIAVDNPLSMYLYCLHRSSYRHALKSRGVAVYNYPLTAGCCPAHHIVINCMKKKIENMHEFTAVIPDILLDELHIDKQRGELTTVAAISCSGTHVYASCSRSGNDESDYPPPWFFEAATSSTAEVNAPDDLYDDEERCWYDQAASGPAHALPYQRHGAAYMHAVLTDGDDSGRYDRAIVSPDEMPALLQNIIPNDNDGRMSIKYSQLEAYLHCPLSLYFDLVLPEQREEYAIDINNSLGIGRVEHAIIAELLRQQEGKQLHANLYEHSADKVKDILVDKKYRLAEYGRAQYIDHLGDNIVRAAQFLCERFEGYYITAVEHALRAAIPHVACDFHGRIDLLLRDPHEEVYTIIDFKHSSQALSTGERRFFQLSFYCELAALNGLYNNRAYYIPIKQPKVFPDINDRRKHEHADPHGIARTHIREGLRACAEAIYAGDFRLRNRAIGCDSCRHPALCRVKLAGNGHG